MGDLDEDSEIVRAFADASADVLLNIASLGFGHAPTIVQSALEAGLNRSIFVSTTAVETTLDAPSKAVRLAAENSVTNSSLGWTIVRPTMIYGAPGDRNIERLLSALRRYPVLPVPGGGGRLQQPVHVDDLAGALVSACSSERAVGATYSLAGPTALSFSELLTEAKAAVASRTLLVKVPMSPVIEAVRIYEKSARRPRIKVEQLQRLSEDKSFAIDAAVRDLGYSPRSFSTGVHQEARALWPD
jgi:nucleoside-diphosphate-sugar epimerase